jgi:hypothetical protein
MECDGLTNHIQEIILYLNINKKDILLKSETHATDRTYAKIPYYTVYFANHPDIHTIQSTSQNIRTSILYSLLRKSSGHPYYTVYFANHPDIHTIQSTSQMIQTTKLTQGQQSSSGQH